jgi:inward rectifier potassium channel
MSQTAPARRGRSAPSARRVRRGRNRKDGIAPIVRIGVPREGWRDVYHYLLVQSWTGFFGLLIALYLLLNVAFAILYTLQPDSVDGARPGALADAFFFSVETMATVGYGAMHPATLYGHVVVTIELLVGVLTVPLATGLIIAKFTRPTAHVLFSRNALVSRFEGVPTLMFRLANIRANQIIEARVKVTMLMMQQTEEGHNMRRMIDLPVLRDTSPIFALSWTVMHPITEDSPLSGMGPDDCRAEGVQILIVMTGIDGTTSSTVYARHGYAAPDSLFEHAFDDVVELQADGSVHIDFARFHDTRPMRVA